MLMNEQGQGASGREPSWEAVGHGARVTQESLFPSPDCPPARQELTHLWRNASRSQDWSWCLRLGLPGKAQW